METIRLGLIGCGGMMSTHVIGVKYVDHVEIVAVCDIIEEKAQKVADALGVRCVLCAQGSHAAWRLRAVAPTGDTLLGAVRTLIPDF